jgi:hypothetical protein
MADVVAANQVIASVTVTLDANGKMNIGLQGKTDKLTILGLLSFAQVVVGTQNLDAEQSRILKPAVVAPFRGN